MEADTTIISKENSEKQLESLFDWYDINLDDYKDDPEESEGAIFVKAKAKIKRAIESGLVEIREEQDGQGDPTLKVYQKLTKKYAKMEKDTICYAEVSGRSKAAIRTNKKQGDFSRMYQFLGALSGEGESLFLRMKGRDNSIAECLGFVFLQV